MAKPTIDQAWAEIMTTATTPQELFARLREWVYPHERMQDPKKKIKLNRNDGPMAYLGEVICKKMEKAGYPSIVHACWRSPEEQDSVFAKGRSKAKAWQSPHQYLEAVDIVHKSKFWQASPDYWEMLATVVRTVGHEYNVALDHGHNWSFVDSAHIELSDWRNVRDQQKERGFYARPTPEELAQRFKQVLPSI